MEKITITDYGKKYLDQMTLSNSLPSIVESSSKPISQFTGNKAMKLNPLLLRCLLKNDSVKQINKKNCDSSHRAIKKIKNQLLKDFSERSFIDSKAEVFARKIFKNSEKENSFENMGLQISKNRNYLSKVQSEYLTKKIQEQKLHQTIKSKLIVQSEPQYDGK